MTISDVYKAQAEDFSKMISFKDEKDREALLSALILNMNEEFRATLQYICHRISAKGQDTVLAETFKTAALDEMAHILLFSDLLTRLDGKPTFTNWDIDQSSQIRKMLEADIALERDAEKRYTQQRERFKDYREFTNLVNQVLLDESDHEDTFTKYLRDSH